MAEINRRNSATVELAVESAESAVSKKPTHPPSRALGAIVFSLDRQRKIQVSGGFSGMYSQSLFIYMLFGEIESPKQWLEVLYDAPVLQQTHTINDESLIMIHIVA